MANREEGALRILVAEDDKNLLKLITFLLKKNYYKVDVVHYEVELLESIRKKRPGIIILDVVMDNMDTVEVIRKIKEDESMWGIPVLCISSKGHELKLMKALQEGADAYIVKPFTPRDLLNKIVASLKR